MKFVVGSVYMPKKTIWTKFSRNRISEGKKLICVYEDGVKCLKLGFSRGGYTSWHYGQFDRKDFYCVGKDAK